MASFSRNTLIRSVASLSFVIVNLCLNSAEDRHSAERSIHSALVFAAGEGKSEEVKHLLEEGADVNHRNEYGETPLH
eukprot:8268461-Pyramimonas_sp.AAC.1